MTAINAEDEVVGLCRDLIRIDSTNAGDNSGPGERAAAEYVAEKLSEVGLEPKILESDSRRANVIARIAGRTPPVTPCCSTGTWTSSPSTPPTGPSTRSVVRSPTAASGGAARST